MLATIATCASLAACGSDASTTASSSVRTTVAAAAVDSLPDETTIVVEPASVADESQTTPAVTTASITPASTPVAAAESVAPPEVPVAPADVSVAPIEDLASTTSEADTGCESQYCQPDYVDYTMYFTGEESIRQDLVFDVGVPSIDVPIILDRATGMYLPDLIHPTTVGP